jgi:hypothetical protein
VGIIRPRILLSAAFDGRATFLLAGAVLGVGVYGFAITFKPYESGRVLQPFPILGPVVMKIEVPTFEPPSVVLPEVSTSVERDAPAAPGESLVSIPRPVTAAAVARPQAPSVAAAAADGAAPLDPVPAPEPTSAPAPRELPPVVIAPENVLVYIHPGYGPREDSTAGDDDVEAPASRSDAAEDEEDSKRRSQARARSDRDDDD